MKRFWSLLLVLALLASIVVVPVSAETGTDSAPTLSFEIGTFTYDEKGMGSITLTEAKEKYQENDLVSLAIKITPDSAVRFFRGGTFFVNYDTSVFEPFTATSKYGVSAGPAYTTLANWSCEGGKPQDGVVSCAVGSGSGLVPLDPEEGTQLIFYFLFKVKQEVESATCEFTFHKDNEAKLVYTETIDPKAPLNDILGVDYDTPKTSLTIEGKAPTLGSITVTPTDGLSGNAVYGTPRTYTLKAFSTSKKDITSLVMFRDGHNGAGLSMVDYTDPNAPTMSTSTDTPAGKYEIYAVARTADGTALCTVTENGYDKGAFTVDKQTLTSAAVTITGFGKGLSVDDVDAEETHDSGFNTYVTVLDTTDTILKADTAYTIKLELKPIPESAPGETYSPNYQFTSNTTLTVNGLGADIKPDNITVTEKGYLTATVTARTGAKDIPEVTMTPITATFGDKLSSFTPEGTATYGGKKVNGTYAWEDPDQTVGNAGTKVIYAVFTPTESEKYSTVTAPVTVTVNKKVITFSASDFVWTAAVAGDETADGSSVPFGYNGKPHGVKLRVHNTSIQDFVTIAYQLEDGTTSTTAPTKINVGTYNTTAVIDVADKENCELQVETGKTPTTSFNWSIAKGKLSDAEKTIGVRFGTTSLTVTPDQLGLPTGENFTVTYPTTTENTVIQSMSASGENMVFTLKPTTAADVNKYDALPLIYSSANYVDVTINLMITIINKDIDESTVSISGPQSVEYGTAYDFTYHGVPDDAKLISTAYTNTETSASTAKPEDVGGYKISCTWESSTTIYKAEYVFEITARDISKTTATIADLTYTGEAQPATLTVKDGEKTLTQGMDYTVDEADLKKTDANTYTVTITGTGNYTGKMEKKYQILPRNIGTATDVTVEAITAQTYTGSAIIPEPVVKHGSTTLEKDKDYTVSYANNVNASTETSKATVTITGTGNYTGTKTVYFTINQLDISETATVDQIADVTYTGSEHKPEPVVKLDGTTLEKGKDYTVSYENNTNAGTATVKIAFTGNYTGTLTKNFTIGKKTLTSSVKVPLTVRYDDLTAKTIDLTQYLQGVPASSIKATATNGENLKMELTPVNDDAGKWTGKVTYQLKASETIGTTLSRTVTLDYDSNYAPTTVEISLVFTFRNKLNQADLFYTGATTMTYDQSIPLTYTGGSGSGEVYYTVATVVGDTGEATVSGSTLTAIKAGTVRLTVHKYGDDTYLAQSSTEYVITINKATPAAPAEIKVDDTDTTLGELGREMVKKIGVSGTIKWYDSDNKQITDPDNTKIEANKEYSWTFVPADGTNYNEIYGKTTPYVRDDLSWLPGVINGGSNFTFHDVNRFDYYYDSVKWAADNGIASGTSRFAFSPDAVCTRAQTVTFLWRAAGSPLPRYRACPFTDVNANDYYYDAVLWAVEQGITTGLTATTFGPDETVTRGQVATFLYRAASAAKPNTFNPFMDVKPTAYNYDAILWAYDNRITTGTSTTTFSPDAFCTRAQIVTFLYRYYQGR